jgi:propanediol dehydratase small subunit
MTDADNQPIRAASGKPLDAVTLDAALGGELSADDIRIHGETLRAQAEVAKAAGYHQLAQNWSRAAELTLIPNEQLLKIYEMLRPERSTYDELIALADTLESTYSAAENARFIREAAEVYQQRGLLRR